MRYFITALFFCSFFSLLEFSHPRQNDDIWPLFMEKMRRHDSEYIDADLLLSSKSTKYEGGFSSKHSRKMKTSESQNNINGITESLPMESQNEALMPTASAFSLNSTEKKDSTFEMGGESIYEPELKASSDDRTKPYIQTMDWNLPQSTFKNVIDGKEQLSTKSGMFYSDKWKADSIRRTRSGKMNEENNSYRTRRFFRTITVKSATILFQNNITSQYKQNNSLQSNREVSNDNNHVSTSFGTSSKDFMNTLSFATKTNSLKPSPEHAIFNSSTVKSSSDKTSNSSVICIHSAPNSRLSKTAVAAIVAAINGIIGFIGAAIFTCKKQNFLRIGERLPLIR